MHNIFKKHFPHSQTQDSASLPGTWHSTFRKRAAGNGGKPITRLFTSVLAAFALFCTWLLPITDAEAAIPDIHGGESHSAALKTDGTVWTWGCSGWGELGHGNFDCQYTPLQIVGLNHVRAIAAYYVHTVALKDDGTVWAWGNNWSCQLGIDDPGNHQSSPVQVMGLNGVNAIAAGGYHTLALKDDGTLWAWGDNGRSQLGTGNTHHYQSTPEQVAGLTGVIAIAAGLKHTVALKDDGTVWTWGDNANGQLGIGNTTEQASPVQVMGLTDVTAITAGWDHTVALKNDGTIWVWGHNEHGQLGIGNTTEQASPVHVTGLTDMSAIAAGAYYTVALKDDGTIWAWGDNYDGQLGIGNTTDQHSPVQVAGVTDVNVIAAGMDHTMALKNDGTVLAWGYNKTGQLGIGNTTDQHSPVQIPNFSVGSAQEAAPISPADEAVVAGWPDLVWQGVEGAYQYEILLDSQVGVDKTYTVFASQACDPDTRICTIEDAGLQPFLYGDYQWQEISWKAETDPDWTTAEFEDTFIVIAAFPQAPEGIIANPLPNYRWQMNGEHTTRFRFKLSGQILSDNIVREAWADVADACSGETCELGSETPLLNGDYVYRLQQWSQEMGGDGALSNLGKFTIVQGDSLLQPRGLAAPGEEMTFRWREVLDMNAYDISVTNSADEIVFTESVSSVVDGQPICTGGVCERTVDLDLEVGSYTWSLRAKYLDTSGNVIEWLDGRALEASFQRTENLTEISAAGGEAVSLDGMASALFSPNAVSEPVLVSITPVSDISGLLPNSGYALIGNIYEFLAVDLSGAPVTTFEADLEITLSYLAGDVNAGSEQTLIISYYDDASGEWHNLPPTVDTIHQNVSALSDRFTKFAIFAPGNGENYLLWSQ